MRNIEITRIIALAWLLVTITFAAHILPAQAQVAHQSGTTSSDVWISHQMNQPPPGAGDRYDVSPDRLDEIRQLYMQARQEQDGKKDAKPQDKK
ncbi:MAG: hypothetical protein HY912_07900 [Desulfomonile tiedjei]|uniref:DUF4148 domain-containing protein n=1 Tax=Desulfomonile tiedjei TaxID=2358 RepID=A0A9D6Z3A3_9BACT|nr:hypothetical protein [Desulfomonile tiedjei]